MLAQNIIEFQITSTMHNYNIKHTQKPTIQTHQILLVRRTNASWKQELFSKKKSFDKACVVLDGRLPQCEWALKKNSKIIQE